MALGKAIGNFSFKMTSVNYGSDGTTTVDFDGTADGFGTCLGTMSFSGESGAKVGPCTWAGEAFTDDGQVLRATGEGAVEEIGKHKWRTRLVLTVSDGQIFASDGLIDLANRSLTGKNLEWT